MVFAGTGMGSDLPTRDIPVPNTNIDYMPDYLHPAIQWTKSQLYYESLNDNLKLILLTRVSK
jgi:hypothetical protein